MNITGSLFAISQFESMKKKIEADKKLEEVTIEDQEQRKSEGQGQSKEEPVQADEGVENIQKETNRGKGSDLSELWEEDEASSMPPRRRKRRKLSESEPR